MYVQQQIQRSCLKNLKRHQQHFPRKQAMLQQPFLQAFSLTKPNLYNHFFKPLCLLMQDLLPPPPPLPSPPPKTPAITSRIVEIVIERVVSIKNMVMPCSRNKVRILSAKDVFLSRTFPRVCLILATSV